MLSISPDILKRFDAVLEKKTVPFSIHADYRKWLRYYRDFRAKYSLPNSRSEQVRLFVEKLREKNQKNYYDLHLLCAEQNSQRDEESAGFLIT